MRCLVGARERFIRLRKDHEGHIRDALKTFGIRMVGTDEGRQRQAFREQLAARERVATLSSPVWPGFGCGGRAVRRRIPPGCRSFRHFEPGCQMNAQKRCARRCLLLPDSPFLPLVEGQNNNKR
ncbi:hypothetical protein SAMN04488245_10555 [Alloyangia pacifica]|uniref:Uncharacterized protein n=2 Tax=Alloyangia pacifica TaxID=311180 RepID=A0A1I6STY1_9RHOB|nr:hypothetical protein SAMN04488245_10555 [Alloyangia pacifica]SFS80366.1 hypothetical protein SAMN04488050_10555 [Alloyangia pacifica]